MIQKIFILHGPFYENILFLHPMGVTFGYVTHFGQKNARGYDIWIHPSIWIHLSLKDRFVLSYAPTHRHENFTSSIRYDLSL